MEKLVYILYADPDARGSDLRSALVEKAAPAIRDAGGSEIRVNVNDEDVAAGTPIHKLDPPVRAMVSFWLDNADDRGPCESALDAHVAGLSGYLVAESRPLIHDAPKGGRTPGMNQVTCIAKKPGLSSDEFFHIWNGDHRVVAIETQSTTGYVRNVVVRALTSGAPPWTGIVEETFPIGALTDPHIFYDASSADDYQKRLARMMASCERFLDFEPMECTHMSEYYLG